MNIETCATGTGTCQSDPTTTAAPARATRGGARYRRQMSHRNSSGQAVILAYIVFLLSVAFYCWKQIAAIVGVPLAMFVYRRRLVSLKDKFWKLGSVALVVASSMGLFWSQLVEFFDLRDEYHQVESIVNEIDT